MIKRFNEYISEKKNEDSTIITYDELKKFINKEFEKPEEPSTHPYSIHNYELQYKKNDIEVDIIIKYRYEEHKKHYSTILYSDVELSTYLDGEIQESTYKLNNKVVSKSEIEKELLEYIESKWSDELEELRKQNESLNDPGNKRVFDYTLYRIPTNEEMKPFENHPEYTAEDVFNEFCYISVGKGIMSRENKERIIKCCEKLISL